MRLKNCQTIGRRKESKKKVKKEITFWEYFDKWVKTYKEGSVREVTLQKYDMTLKSLKKIAPDLKIKDLDRTAYQNIINKYAETHEKVTVKDFHTHLKACISDAMEEKVLENNPCTKAVIKGKAPKEKKVKFLSQFETQLLIKTLDLQDKINIDYLILLLIKTGLRFAEALGLTPEDFDFTCHTITINKTWCYKKRAEGGCFMPTKNASSVRTIQVDWQTMTKFSNLIKDLPSDKPIFLTDRKRNALCNSTANDFLENKCKEAGITVISIHGLRHTHASLLLANGVSVASVAKRLGHSETTTTQRVYLHIIQELENKDNGLAISAMMNLGL